MLISSALARDVIDIDLAQVPFLESYAKAGSAGHEETSKLHAHVRQKTVVLPNRQRWALPGQQ